MNVIIVTDAAPDEIAALLESMKKRKEITSARPSGLDVTSPYTAGQTYGVAMGVEGQVSRIHG